MRGKDCRPHFRRCDPGITPAHAGKRVHPRCQRTEQGDHPRACGEKRGRTTHTAKSRGSPPRMRGKADAMKWARPQKRITPAHAGKSEYTADIGVGIEDHPRACGEKIVALISGGVTLGSPPRMRGKGCTHGASGRNRGITPAHAGKSCLESQSGQPLEDHPRACGEKLSAAPSFRRRPGSPPRMRGKG